jgi:hypothetical protein
LLSDGLLHIPHHQQHTSSNVTITFDPHNADIAYARTSLHVTCGLDEHNLGKTFQEGGVYYWSFRKVDSGGSQGGAHGVATGERWKISCWFLDINWTSGDSLGLNELGAANG